MTILTCKLSDKTFQGFEVRLDMNYINTKEEICLQVKSTLVTHLEWFKFEILAEMAKTINFHIHDHEIGDILMMEENKTLWICNH